MKIGVLRTARPGAAQTRDSTNKSAAARRSAHGFERARRLGPSITSGGVTVFPFSKHRAHICSKQLICETCRCQCQAVLPGVWVRQLFIDTTPTEVSSLFLMPQRRVIASNRPFRGWI